MVPRSSCSVVASAFGARHSRAFALLLLISDVHARLQTGQISSELSVNRTFAVGYWPDIHIGEIREATSFLETKMLVGGADKGEKDKQDWDFYTAIDPEDRRDPSDFDCDSAEDIFFDIDDVDPTTTLADDWFEAERSTGLRLNLVELTLDGKGSDDQPVEEIMEISHGDRGWDWVFVVSSFFEPPLYSAGIFLIQSATCCVVERENLSGPRKHGGSRLARAFLYISDERKT